MPVEDVKEIIVFGEVSLNKRFLEFVTKKEIIIHFLNSYGYYMGSFYPREHLNSGYMILKQAEYYMDENKRLRIAKLFVHGAAANIINVLRYYDNRGKELGVEIQQINALKDKINECQKNDELMAIEGNIREAYYISFNTIIDKPDFVFHGRNRRPPVNVNIKCTKNANIFCTTFQSK